MTRSDVVWTVQNQVLQTVEIWATQEQAHEAARKLVEARVAALKQNPACQLEHWAVREHWHQYGWSVTRNGRDDETYKVVRREIQGLSAVDQLARLVSP